MGILQAIILEWIPMLSCRGSSQPRDQTQLSHIAGRFFTVWATTHTKHIIHPSIRGHLGCFHVFAIVDNAPLNIGVHISSQISVFLSFRCVCVSRSVVFDSLRPHALWPARFSVYGILQAGILEWIAIPFSRGTSQPRDRALVSCIVGKFFTIWATGKSFG